VGEGWEKVPALWREASLRRRSYSPLGAKTTSWFTRVGKAAEWIDATLVFRRSSNIWELFENLHDALKFRQKPPGDAASCLRFVESECVGQVPLGAAV
jgi:hypothetical protein